MTSPALEQIKKHRTLWAIVIPHITPPPAADAARWLLFSPASVEHAIVRTAQRFAREKVSANFNPVDAYRYTTSVASAEARSLREANQLTSATSTEITHHKENQQ